VPLALGGPVQRRRVAAPGRDHADHGLPALALARHHVRGLWLRHGLATPARATAPMAARPGNRRDPAVRRAAGCEPPGRPAPSCAAAGRVVDRPAIPQLHEVPAVAAVRTDDAGAGHAHPGPVRPPAGTAGPFLRYLRPGAVVLLPAPRAVDSPGSL